MEALIRALALSKSDAAVIAGSTVIGTAVGSVAPAGDLHTLIMGAVMAAVSTAVGLLLKGGYAAAAAWLRSDARKKLTDEDPKNDNSAAAEVAFADKLDPPEKK